MPFAILRTAKLSAQGNIAASLSHSFRERVTPNADPSRTAQNVVLCGPSSGAGVREGIDARMPAKVRSNGVRAIEYFIGHSPEAKPGVEYFRDALKWLQDRHGAANVVSAVIHRDETTPHMVAYVVPLDPNTGRLNAARWLDGRKKLSEMQTEFAGRVGRHHGLERGLEGSKATHTTVKEYYAAIQQPETPRITVADLRPKKSRGEGLLGLIGLKSYIETPEGVAGRINASVTPLVRRVRDLEEETRSLRDERKKMLAERKADRALIGPVLEWLRKVKPEHAAMVVRRAVEALMGLHQANEAATQAEAQRQADLRRIERAAKGKDRDRGGYSR